MSLVHFQPKWAGLNNLIYHSFTTQLTITHPESQGLSYTRTLFDWNLKCKRIQKKRINTQILYVLDYVNDILNGKNINETNEHIKLYGKIIVMIISIIIIITIIIYVLEYKI